MMDEDPYVRNPNDQFCQYRFKILTQKGKKPILEKGPFIKNVMGCSTEKQMIEWMSLLLIIQNCKGKFSMRKSALYAENMLKMQLL